MNHSAALFDDPVRVSIEHHERQLQNDYGTNTCFPASLEGDLVIADMIPTFSQNARLEPVQSAYKAASYAWSNHFGPIPTEQVTEWRGGNKWTLEIGKSVVKMLCYLRESGADQRHVLMRFAPIKKISKKKNLRLDQWHR